MINQPHPFDISPISRHIWEQKYRLKSTHGGTIDHVIGDTWSRIAKAAATVERGGKKAQTAWASRFEEALTNLDFIPAGRIIAGAGANRAVTLFNCFVMGPIEDDLGAIFENIKQAALTMQAGGGIGHDFSTLRPHGAVVHSVGADASGPVSFMDVWDSMCRTIKSAGARRGAMMATLRCDHPDIEAFISAKADARRLRNFNLSVLVTDRFVNAVRSGMSWDLVFDGKIYRTVDARALWQKIMRATYDYAEPGVIFIDRINAMNNLAYCEEINATNPCGEQPLPAYGACLLGSINLARLVTAPFEAKAAVNMDKVAALVKTAVRFLDNIIDVSKYPLKPQSREAHAKRRIGLGITGLADALIMCGCRYGSVQAQETAATWMQAIQEAAYGASAELAAEKGSFPLYAAEQFLSRPNIQRLSPATRKLIERHGIRNGCLTSIAPTGTISLLAGNVSSGIEPVFDFAHRRRMLQPDGSALDFPVEDYAFALYRRLHGSSPPIGDAFVSAGEIAPAEHLAMQAAVQRHVDSSISKTINCPADIPFEAFEGLYLEAFDLGLKGCTTFRPNAVTGSVLAPASQPVSANRSMPPPRHPSPTGSRPAVDAQPATAAQKAGAKIGLAPVVNADPRAVVYISKPLERDPVLAGFTYKLGWPSQQNALYVTINDMERGGRRCPFEIFINTKNLEHYAWTVALTRMISAIFRRGGDVVFVAEELKAIFDPQGGCWMDGRYVPSLLAAIGNVIELHMQRIGFLPADEVTFAAGKSAFGADGSGAQHLTQDEIGSPSLRISRAPPPSSRADQALTASSFEAPTADQPPHGSPAADQLHIQPMARGRSCPHCAAPTFVMTEGCWSCSTCGYARCD